MPRSFAPSPPRRASLAAPPALRPRSGWHPVLLAAAIAVGLAVAAPGSHAQTPRKHYDLPAGPLADALNRYARQAGITLSYEAALVAGRVAAPLRGEFGADEGLDRLLASHGLAAQRATDGSYTLRIRPAAGTPSSVTLQQIDVDAALEQPFVNAASTHRLTRADLDRFPATSVGDIFRDMPGVMTANNRNGLGLDLNIRGMQGFGRVKMLVDGTDASSSSYKGYGGESSRAYVDPELLGEITVEKGPNAGPYGAGAVGGVVQMNTLTADDLIRDGNRHGLRVRGSWANNQADHSPYAVLGPGANGSSKPADGVVRPLTLPRHPLIGSVAGAWRIDDRIDLVAGISRRQRGNYVAGKRGNPGEKLSNFYYRPGSEVFNTSEETDSYLLKTAIRLPSDQRLDLGFTRLDSRFGEARSAGFPGYIEQLNLSNIDKRLYTARYAWTPRDNPWVDLRVNVWAAHSREYQAADLRDMAAMGQIHMAQHANTRGRGIELWNTTLLAPLGRELRLKYGVTWLHEKVAIQPLDGGIYMDPNGERRAGSAFLQAEFRPWQSVTLDAGLRRERYRVEGDGDASTGVQNQVQPMHIRQGESRTNPSLGASWQVTRAWQVFGRYGEAWRPPSVKETVNGLVSNQNPSRRLLKPEFVRSTEFGVRAGLDDSLLKGDRLRAGLTWFDNRTRDYVHGTAGAFKNADSAHFRGIELNLDYDAGPVFVRYGYTQYSTVEYCGLISGTSVLPCFSIPTATPHGGLDTVGLYVPPKAQHSVTIGTRWLERRLVVGARAVVARDYGDNTSGIGWSSYHTYDLFGSFRIDRRLSINVSLENLRDRFYLDAGTNNMQAIPAPGRTAKLSVTYAY